MAPPPAIWTVGHSNHALEQFLALVQLHRIDYLVDVRSHPYSRFAPHFNRDALQSASEARDIGYLFLGLALGGRPRRDDQFDSTGHALYGKMAQEPAFAEAIDRLLRGAAEHRLAMLCSCGQPHECHRRLLVGRVLCDHGAELRHILPDGTTLCERAVTPDEQRIQDALFGHDELPWRSARSVSHGRRPSASSHG